MAVVSELRVQFVRREIEQSSKERERGRLIETLDTERVLQLDDEASSFICKQLTRPLQIVLHYRENLAAGEHFGNGLFRPIIRARNLLWDALARCQPPYISIPDRCCGDSRALRHGFCNRPAS